MTYASVCSGIEAATAAWHPLGWQPAWFAEIDPFCNAVLKHHYPEVPNRGDFTAIQDSCPIDLLVGGTPCQSFSVAGQRAGLDDPRGNLTLEFIRLARRLRPRWLVWENVPGVLSIDKGRTFGTILGLLGELGYGTAYRVLDAQYFGVPQRRRRVFVIGHLGDWRRAAAVLFERESMQGDSSPRSQKKQASFEAHICGVMVGTSGAQFTQLAPTLDTHCGTCCRHNEVLMIFIETKDEIALRRPTPRECERLQGFPDDYTLVPYRNKPAADGPRYRAIGNSMAVPVMRWIGERIAIIEEITRSIHETTHP